MSIVSSRLARAATTVAVLSGAVLAAPGAALADSSRTLPIESVGDFVIDGVHQRIFISDPDGGRIVETTYDGKVVATATGLSAVTGLAVSADGDKLYAALDRTSGSIVELTASTLTEITRYPLGTQIAPQALEFVSDRLWFGYYKIGDGGDIGVLDLTGSEPVVTLKQEGTNLWYEAPPLTAGPSGSGLLAGYEPATSGGKVGVYDVSSGTVTGKVSGRVDGGYTRDLAFTADASQIITAAPSPQDSITVVNTADLEPAGSYPIDFAAVAVAVAEDGTVAAGCSRCGPAVRIFEPGTTTPVRTYTLPDTDDKFTGNDQLVDGALLWEPDGDRLFALTVNGQDVYSVRTFAEPKKSLPVLKLSGPSSATRARQLTVTGTLTSTLALPAGAPVTVTRTDLESPSGKALGTRAVSATGAFSFTDTPPAGGTVTYRVSYAGDGTHSAVSATKKVAVSRAATTLKINNSGKIFGYGKSVTFTAQLGSTYKSRIVEIWSDPYGADQGRRLLKRATVNSKGTISASLKLTRNTTVTATFTGDARTAPKTVKSVVYTKTKVSLKLAKYYKTAKIGGVSYRYYHKKSTARVTTTMPAYPGRQVYLQLQVYYGGKWEGAGAQYFDVSSTGTSVISLTGSAVAGYKLRVRAGYRKGDSGDGVNYTTYTPYQYLTFTK